MSKTSQPAALIAISFLLLSAAIQAAETKAVGAQDGLELIVSSKIASGLPQPIVECRLHNTTSQDIPFDLSGPTYRLSFKLLDATGAEIGMDPEWKRLNAYDDKGDSVRHTSFAVSPGSDLLYALPLDDAYGVRWKSGVRLLVAWEPGIDWGIEKPYTKGRGLTVGVEIEHDGGEAATAAEKSPASASPKAQQQQGGLLPSAAKNAPDAMLKNPAASEESASSKSWSLTIVLTIAVLGLLWLLFKRR